MADTPTGLTGYQARFDTDAVVRLADNMIIGPEHVEEWTEYQAWRAKGNVPLGPAPIPYFPPLFMEIVSNTNPSITGVYAYGPDTQQRINSILMYHTLNGTFPGGASTFDWVGADLQTHTFNSINEFRSFANAVIEFDVNAQNMVPVSMPVYI